MLYDASSAGMLSFLSSSYSVKHVKKIPFVVSDKAFALFCTVLCEF